MNKPENNNRQKSDNDPGNQQPTKSMGHGMYTIAWLFGIALLTLMFSGREERKINPNQNPESTLQNGVAEVILKQNRQGHYVTNGTINGYEVVFLLDTGATHVSVPAHIADKIGLQRGRTMATSTANGVINVYQSWIQDLTIGTILLNDLDANINPEMKEDFILLGMSALKKLEFTQRDDVLILRAYR